MFCIYFAHIKTHINFDFFHAMQLIVIIWYCSCDYYSEKYTDKIFPSFYDFIHFICDDVFTLTFNIVLRSHSKHVQGQHLSD